jgi:hypothetical protein
VDARSGLGSVEAQAGLGVGVVGDLGTVVGVDGGVRLAGGEDLEAARGEQGAQADAQSEGEVLFGLGVELAAGVVAAVQRIDGQTAEQLGKKSVDFCGMTSRRQRPLRAVAPWRRGW